VNIVLLEPEIPHNTGAIGRTCYVTGAVLHLIHPLGFFINDKTLRRSGMDYWNELDVRHYDDFADFLDKNPAANLYFIETFGDKIYSDIQYQKNDYLIFGSESKGIARDLIERHGTAVKIPMIENSRSLNLSVSVGIVLYEALRQTGWEKFYA